MVGLALGNNPPYEFDIKPHNLMDNNTEMDGCEPAEQDQTVTIKIKVKSKRNPNYIKLIGMAEIKMSQLISGTNTTSWFKLYSMKGGQRGREEVISKDPIGKINLESNFFENSSIDDDESKSEDESLHNIEAQYAKKVAAAAGKQPKQPGIWNPAYIQQQDLDLIDDQKLLSKPYWLQQRSPTSK